MPDTLTDTDRAAIREELIKKIAFLRDDEDPNWYDGLRRDPAANIQDDAIPLTMVRASINDRPGFFFLLGHTPVTGVLHFSILLDNDDDRAIAECIAEIEAWLEGLV